MRDNSFSKDKNLKIDRRILSNFLLGSRRWRERELKDKIIRILSKVKSRLMSAHGVLR